MRKRWEKAILHKWHSEASHTFLLYLNVSDDIWNEEAQSFEHISEHLLTSTPVGKSTFTAFFNRGSGVHFPNDEMEMDFLLFLSRIHPEVNMAGKNAAVQEFHDNRRKVSYALSLFGEMLHIGWEDARGKNELKKLALLSLAEDGAPTDTPFFSVVIEYTETIAPQDHHEEKDRDALVTLLVWARDRDISRKQNIVVLTADSLNSVAPPLRSETNGFTALKIEFPDLDDRKVAIDAIRKQIKPHAEDLKPIELARMSSGMSLNSIRMITKEMGVKRAPITSELVFAKKKRFVEDQSGGLIETIQPLWGLEAIGGLHEHKRFAKDIARVMREGNILAVPMGILLLGAPGTGKTVFVEAIAREAGLPFVKFKNVREMWV